MLNNLRKIKDKSKKRIGRGGGSGKGFHTATRGQKGQTSRAGYFRRKDFQGGQKPLSKKLPRIRKSFTVVKKEKPKTIKIDFFYNIGVTEINPEVVSKYFSTKNYIITGSSSSDIEYSKFVLSGVKLTNKLKEQIIASGGKVE